MISVTDIMPVKVNHLNNGFINREEEIDLVESLLTKIQQGIYFRDWIIEFYGIHGIGKTTLMEQVSRICKIKSTPCIKFDFYELKRFRRYQKIVKLRIKKELQIWQPNIISRTSELIAELPEEQEMGNSRTAGYIHVFLNKMPLVLMFDTIEQADLAHLEWLESFFRLLVSERRTGLLIILAGRVDVYWPRFEVRQHSRSWKLSPFNSDHTGEQLLSLHKDYLSLAKNIHQLTYGHPLNNQTVVENLLSLQEDGYAVGHENFKDYEPRLISRLMNKFIEKYALQSMSEEKFIDAIKLIAPLRRFDIDLLDQFIEHFSLPYKGAFRALMLRSDMLKSLLVAYDEQKKALGLDPTIRRILALHMRHFAVERYREVNQFAVSFNSERLQEASGTDRTLFTAEILYHRANLLTLSGKSAQEIGQLLTEDLFEIANQMTLVDAQQLQAELAKDAELEDVMAEGFSLILQAIEQIVKRKQNL